MKRLYYYIFFSLAQIILCLLVGYAAMNLTVPADVVRDGVVFSGIDFSGADVSAAAASIANIGKRQSENGVASFVYNNTEFLFHYSEIGLSADYSGLEARLPEKGSKFYLNNLLSGFIRRFDSGFKPVYSVDPALFKSKLLGMKEYIDANPKNADIELTAYGDIVFTPSEDGVYLDVDGQFDRILSLFLSDPLYTFIIDSDAMVSNSALVITEPAVPSALLADVDAVLAQIKIPVPDGYDFSLVAKTAEAINKVWAPGKGNAYAPFSFLRYIENAGLPSGEAAAEYDLVASALMHALLVSGEDFLKTEFNVSGDADAYPDLPGFGVAIIGGGVRKSTGAKLAAGSAKSDLKFTNTLDGNIVVFASAADGELNVAVAGNSRLAAGGAPYAVYVEIDGGRVRLFRGGKKLSELPA